MAISILLRFAAPREMLRLIEKYEAEGTLNQNAIQYLSRKVKKNASIIAAISAIFYICDHTNVWLSMALIFSLPFMVRYDFRNTFRNHIAVYSFGHKVDTTVVSFRLKYPANQVIYGIQYIECRLNPISGEMAKSIPISLDAAPKMPKEICPQAGDSLSVFYDPTEKYMSMPDIKFLKDLFSLTTQV